jgi:hypothetical protein
MSQLEKHLIKIIHPDPKGSPPTGYHRQGIHRLLGKASNWDQWMFGNVPLDIQKCTKEEDPHDQKNVGIGDSPTNNTGLIPSKVEKNEAGDSSDRSREIESGLRTSLSGIVFIERKDEETRSGICEQQYSLNPICPGPPYKFREYRPENSTYNSSGYVVSLIPSFWSKPPMNIPGAHAPNRENTIFFF